MNPDTNRNTRTTLPLLVLLLGTLPWLTACGGQNEPAATASGATAQASEALEAKAHGIGNKVREEMAREDIKLDSDAAGAGKARITPEGDLYIDGKRIAVDDEQRALLLAYRGHITEVAASGAEIGIESAKVATQAVGVAIASIFSGESSDEIGARIEADVEKKIRGSVAGLCSHLPALMETQQALVASLPEFEPYADMDGSDIDECMDETTVADASTQDADKQEADNDARDNEAAEAEAASRQ